MGLSRLCVVLILASIACRDSSAPTIFGMYELVSVDGQSLPITTFGIDTGTSLLSSTLYFDFSGKVVKVDKYRDYSVVGGVRTYPRSENASGVFTINGQDIIIIPTSECFHLCGTADIGTFSTSTIELTPATTLTSSHYFYRRVTQ